MRLILCCFLAVSACAQFPALDGVVPPDVANAPYPDLVPLAPVVARAATSESNAAFAQEDITSRLAALRARAARLRGPVIGPQTRARMMRGVR